MNMLVHRLVCFVCVSCFAHVCVAQLPDDSLRLTPLVKVIQKVEPSVVALFIPDANDARRYSSGSGAVIHEDGYAVTNNHVVKSDSGYALLRGKPVRFKVVGRSPEKDLAIIKLRDHQGHLPVVKLGHSHDVMNGESVAVMGNPGGRGITVTAGIVSSKGTQLTAPNALWASKYDTKWRDDYIQYDAATNRGNSGGPLINMDAELIGVVSALIPTEQNSSFAIPIDRVRTLCRRVLEPELVHQQRVGIELNSQADSAIVTSVVSGTPAERAGIQAFDVVQSVNGRPLRTAADWWFTLDTFLPKGEVLSIVVKRGDERLPVEVKPERWTARKPVKMPDEKLQAGLKFEIYSGEFSLLPDFDKLKNPRQGSVAKLDLDEIQGEQEDYFAVKLKGFLKIVEDGLYRVNLSSDDGSRLHLHGEVFIDHDGNHPSMTLSRLTRLSKGLHPIEIEYFEGYGEDELTLKLDRLGDGKPETMPEFVCEKSE